MFGKFFGKSRAFFKTKLVYLTLAGFLRKLLLYMDLKYLDLYVRGIPVFLPETLRTLHAPTITPYPHPFHGATVDEIFVTKRFRFKYFMFFRSKPYTFMKSRGMGRIKRNLRKRLVKSNNITD